jgi:hypothetical protein
MTLPPKVTMIMSLIVNHFHCDGGHAQNLATQIYNHHPQMTVKDINDLLATQFNVTGTAVLFLKDDLSTDIFNVLNS